MDDHLYPHTHHTHLIGAGYLTGLIPDLSRLQTSAPRTGDLCFRLPSAEEVYSHTILFFPGTIDELSSPTGETDARGLEVWNIPPKKEGTFRQVLRLENVNAVIRTLQEHYRLGGGGYKIVVKNPATSAVEGTFYVHRALLGERVPYFGTLFSSGFGDSAAAEGVLWSDTVTAPAAEMLQKWCYLAPELLQLPAAASCADEDVAETPTVETLLDTAVAADFLATPDLQNYCLSALRMRAHNFTCQGVRCTDAVPRILAGVHCRPQLERIAGDLYSSALALLAQMGSIQKMWKRRVIELPDKVLTELVDAVAEGVGDSQSAFRCFLTVSKLRSKVAASKMKARWEEVLLLPLLGRAAGVAAAGLRDGYLASQVQKLRQVKFERAAVEEMVLAVADAVKEGNCGCVYEGLLGMSENEEVVRRARGKVQMWLRRNWLSFSVVEGNVFEREWKEDMVVRLAGELGVEKEDLLGNRRKGRGKGGQLRR